MTPPSLSKTLRALLLGSLGACGTIGACGTAGVSSTVPDAASGGIGVTGTGGTTSSGGMTSSGGATIQPADAGVIPPRPDGPVSGGGTILWRDSLQGGGARDWGFNGLEIERNDQVITGSDAMGANLTRVADPLGGSGYALRHFCTFDQKGCRAQAGIWGFDNTTFGTQAKKPEGVWVAMEWYFPMAITAGGDEIPWLSVWDWHSTDGESGGNRWHTSPGMMLARDGSMKVRWEWGGDAEQINRVSSWSTMPLPVGRWFDIEMHYTWATSGATLELWIDGQLALQQTGVATRRSSHTVVETYSKFYGSQNDGTRPWAPMPATRYTRNVRVANGRIWPQQ